MNGYENKVKFEQMWQEAPVSIIQVLIDISWLLKRQQLSVLHVLLAKLCDTPYLSTV